MNGSRGVYGSHRLRTIVIQNTGYGRRKQPQLPKVLGSKEALDILLLRGHGNQFLGPNCHSLGRERSIKRPNMLKLGVVGLYVLSKEIVVGVSKCLDISRDLFQDSVGTLAHIMVEVEIPRVALRRVRLQIK